jgi:hypothetical protein
MFRLSGHGSGNDFWIWLFDDHAEANGGDHNLVSAWEDLLEGAAVVVVEGCTAYVPPDDTVIPKIKEVPQGPWVTFTFDMVRRTAKKNIHFNVGALKDGKEYLVRFSIDGGAWLGPLSIRWAD